MGDRRERRSGHWGGESLLFGDNIVGRGILMKFSLEELELDAATSKYNLRKARQMDDEENEEEL